MSALFDEDQQHYDPTTNELLIGGKVYIGDVGVNPIDNPKAVYGVRALTGAALAQPLIIGSDGRVATKGWTSGKYSYQINSSADVLKYQELDNGVDVQVGNSLTTNSLGVNDITVTGSPTITELIDGQAYVITVPANNTGSVTLKIDTTPVTSVRKNYDEQLIAHDLQADQKLIVLYNETDSRFEAQSLTNNLPSTYSTKSLVAALTLTSEDAGRKIFITSVDGGEFTIRYNATAATYADNGGIYCGTVFIPSGGDGTIGIVRNYYSAVNVVWFGAIADGVTDDTAAFSAATIADSSSSFVPDGTYLTAGTTVGKFHTDGDVTITTGLLYGISNILNQPQGSVMPSGQNVGNTTYGYRINASMTGGFNTSIGYRTCEELTTGIVNVAIGADALLSATDANNNVAVGGHAMTYVVGDSNTAIGQAALEGLFTDPATVYDANNNVAIGENALNSIADAGNENTAVGNVALAKVTTGTKNVAVGIRSGWVDGTNSVSTASRTTFIGADTGYNAATQYTNCTAIGADAKVSASNQMQFGDTNVTDFSFGIIPMTYTITGIGATMVNASGYVTNTITNSSSTGYARQRLTSNSSGTPSSAYIDHAPGLFTKFWTDSSANAIQVIAGTVGVSLSNGGNSWAAISDERKKDIIEPITDALDKVDTLRSVIGKYKTDEEGTRRSFLLAQDVQNVLPEAVKEDAEGTLLLAMTDVIPLLVASIKELSAKVEALENA
jgi:hypothetical protein